MVFGAVADVTGCCHAKRGNVRRQELGERSALSRFRSRHGATQQRTPGEWRGGP